MNTLLLFVGSFLLGCSIDAKKWQSWVMMFAGLIAVIVSQNI